MRVHMRVAMMGVVGVLWGCATAVPPPAKSPPAEAVPASSFAAVLAQAREDAKLRQQLVLEAEGQLAAGVTALLLFGDGVAVLNGNRQFRLPDVTLVAVLDLVIQQGVASWPEESTVPEGNALEIHRRLSVWVGEASHRVIERNRRPPRPSLQRLLEQLVEIVRPFAADGVEPSSLQEGLSLVVEGTLAPHVLAVNALAPATPGAEEGPAGGWQLTLQRNLLTGSRYTMAEGVTVLWRHPATAVEVVAFARTLLEVGAVSFPRQIHMPAGHFQLHVELLGHRLNLQARPFSGKGAAQGAEAREALETLRGRFYEMFSQGTRGLPSAP